MIDNMADMENMEVIKPGYIEKRRIKAYILGVKLRNFNMMNEYNQLDNAFQNTWHAMYSDDEVVQKIVQLRNTNQTV